eukprot:GEMP01099162.1.p1 GENE.GEMP01099162.1~~GEMP01099162.1.p1  ORF type:complete len:106 (+),score=25.50 GEMP01099162.1:70-387(+)
MGLLHHLASFAGTDAAEAASNKEMATAGEAPDLSTSPPPKMCHDSWGGPCQQVVQGNQMPFFSAIGPAPLLMTVFQVSGISTLPFGSAKGTSPRRKISPQYSDPF